MKARGYRLVDPQVRSVAAQIDKPGKTEASPKNKESLPASSNSKGECPGIDSSWIHEKIPE